MVILMSIFLKNATLDDSAQKYSKELQKSCAACALGTCLISLVKLENKLTLRDLRFCHPEYVISSTVQLESQIMALSRVFSKKQIAMIEWAYERFDPMSEGSGITKKCGGLTYKDQVACKKFGDKVYNKAYDARALGTGITVKAQRATIRAIMNNIIKNEGTFVPPKRPKELVIKTGYSLRERQWCLALLEIPKCQKRKA